MPDLRVDVAVVGGGIVGVATAMAVTSRTHVSLAVVEKEPRLAAHQTGNNSGVIHSGLYYKPGSLKARNCAAGREALLEFCERHGIKAERCGKVVVATRADQIPGLEELHRRGEANGLAGIRRLRPEEIREIEPHAAGVAGLFVPQTGIVDYVRVTEAYAQEVRRAGGEVLLSAPVRKIARDGDGIVVEAGEFLVRCRFLINCAGLHSDRVARLAGVNPGVLIVPFRGEYYELTPDRHHLVRNLIYPVPDPEFPFLGVHFTRMIEGGVEAGPNAVLALKREGYSRWSFSLRDAVATAAYPGFWRMAGSYWRMGFGEYWRSFNRRAFVRALQALMPEIAAHDLVPGGAGVRAQALDRSGKLLDDFRIVEADRQVHVLNAPSPAATASISIGEEIAEIARKAFALR
ncbi:MAG TPA: L-2-hydroxyglutarate oxidase [Thermoanaerobaculaceae bacterium]|nr:L-2-hydroxyglutarate oxidase [Thermoanaerobaculaceae bacterium]